MGCLNFVINAFKGLKSSKVAVRATEELYKKQVLLLKIFLKLNCKKQ